MLASCSTVLVFGQYGCFGEVFAAAGELQLGVDKGTLPNVRREGHDLLLDVLAYITSLVGGIGGTRLVGIVRSSARDVVTNGLSLSTGLVDLRLVGVVLAGLLDVGADGSGGVGQLVDGVLGVTLVEESVDTSEQGRGKLQAHTGLLSHVDG